MQPHALLLFPKVNIPAQWIYSLFPAMLCSHPNAERTLYIPTLTTTSPILSILKPMPNSYCFPYHGTYEEDQPSYMAVYYSPIRVNKQFFLKAANVKKEHRKTLTF